MSIWNSNALSVRGQRRQLRPSGPDPLDALVQRVRELEQRATNLQAALRDASAVIGEIANEAKALRRSNRPISERWDRMDALLDDARTQIARIRAERLT